VSERIRRIRVLIEREDGQMVGWELDQPGYITATASEKGHYSRSRDNLTQDFTLSIHSDGPVRRILPDDQVLTPTPTIEGTVQ
jgi:hypothetical protein